MAFYYILILSIFVLWVGVLYAVLTILRTPRIWGVGSKYVGSEKLQNIESKVSANLSNQFEWPVFYLVGSVLVLSQDIEIGPSYIAVGGLFILGRVSHSIVQICSNSIRLRGLVFMVNFVAVFLLWGKLLKDLAV